MQSYEILTFFICLAAVFSYVNYRFIKWPPTIGVMALSQLASIILIAGVKLSAGKGTELISIITSINFHSLLMNSMLGFLLFAGSIHIDTKHLRKERLPIITLATAGILLSTLLVGTMLHLIFIAFHMDVGYIY